MSKQVPFIDLAAQHASIAPEVEARIASILEGGHYVGGEALAEFENDFATYCQTTHAIGVGSGTDALRISLEAMGIGKGSEIVTTSYCFVAIAEAATQLGARLKFVDVDPRTGNIDPAGLRDAVTDDTDAIVVVHMFGRPADLDEIVSIANEYGCAIIEDAGQAIGASYKEDRVGSFGDLACFSFYPTKNLGGYGDGGAVTTRSGELAERVRALANHGSLIRHQHDSVGWNSRLDAVQAGILSVKLEYLNQWNSRRREIAAGYDTAFADLDGITILPAYEFGESACHIYPIRVENRDEVRTQLDIAGVETGIHYAKPIHQQQPYRHLFDGGASLIHAERWSSSEISLPIYPELSDEAIEHVISSVVESVREYTRTT